MYEYRICELLLYICLSKYIGCWRTKEKWVTWSLEDCRWAVFDLIWRNYAWKCERQELSQCLYSVFRNKEPYDRDLWTSNHNVHLSKLKVNQIKSLKSVAFAYLLIMIHEHFFFLFLIFLFYFFFFLMTFSFAVIIVVLVRPVEA